MNARIGPLALVTFLALGTAACRRHAHPHGPRTWGPALGDAHAVLHAVRVLNPPRTDAHGPFVSAVLTDGGALGIAGGALYRLDAPSNVGGTRVDAFGRDHVVALAPAGGATVYALLDASRPYVSRSDDGGRTWTRGATVSEGPLPPIPLDYSRANVEAIPGLVASARAVAFWLGDAVSVSRDGGASFAAVDVGGMVHSLAMSRAGSVMALVRLRPPPDDEPPGIVRVDAAGVVTRTVLPHADSCAAARVYAVADGTVALGSERGLLGLCARVSHDDGRSFAEVFADATAREGIALFAATPSGMIYRAHDPGASPAAQEGSTDGGRTFTLALPPRAPSRPWDATIDGRVAAAAVDALALAPPGIDPGRLNEFASAMHGDLRYQHAVAAAQGAIAWMDPRGVVSLVDQGPDGPRVRVLDAPCSFPSDTPRVRDLPLLALDGAGTLCCTGLPGATRGATAHSACADIRVPSPVFHELDRPVQALASGEGAMGVLSPSPACRLADDAATMRAVTPAVGDSGAAMGTRDVSCASGGAAIALVQRTLWQVSAVGTRDGRSFHELASDVGLRAHVLARQDGTLILAGESPAGIGARVFAPGSSRPLASWTGDGAGYPSVIAPWDRFSAVLTVRNALVVASPLGVHTRPFANGESYDAVARVGDTLVGITPEGRFAVLQPVTP